MFLVFWGSGARLRSVLFKTSHLFTNIYSVFKCTNFGGKEFKSTSYVMSAAERSDYYEIEWPRVVLFGDSLTQRSFEPKHGLWGTLLADKFQRYADIVARGFSGYNTRMCKVILPRLFNSRDIKPIKAFVILLGSNDSCSPHEEREVHVPLDEYSDNLMSMVDYLKCIGISEKKIILVTPPPYNHEAFLAFANQNGLFYPEKDNKTVGEYAKACVAVAKQCNVEVCDIFTEMMKHEKWEDYLVDGLHFSHAGSTKLFSLLYPVIEKRLNTKRMILPHWSEVDPNNPVPDLTGQCFL